MSNYYCTPYNGNDPFLFISYSHTDYYKVETILNILYRQGFRIWYDEHGAGIDTGKDWLEHIYQRIDSSRAFLGFISSSTEFRQIALGEISKAIEKKKKNPEYKVVLIMLEKVSPERFPENIRNEMKTFQFIDFQKWGGITEKFTEVLFGCDWDCELIDNNFRKTRGLKPWNPKGYEIEIRDSFDEIFKDLGFLAFNKFKFSEKKAYDEGEEFDFFAVSPDGIDQNTVYPIAMDNQWIPTELLKSGRLPECIKNGLQHPDMAEQIIPKQRYEIFRSLLHNWQIVVNRASIENSKVFSDWYFSENEEYEAFKKLIESGAMVIYLMNEKTPIDTPRYSYDEEAFEKWKKFCKNTPVFCLRFDWNDESNKYEYTNLLGYKFQNFCMTTVSDSYRLEYFMNHMNITEEDERNAFLECWKNIRNDVLKCNDEDGKNYNRDRFYRNFIIKDGTEPEQGIIDTDKPFAIELKEIIDFQYCVNLPSALQIQPLVPVESGLGGYLLSESAVSQRQREMDMAELIFAVNEFEPEFIADFEQVTTAEACEFSIVDVWNLRQLNEWAEYMRAVTEGKQRSLTSHIDLHTIGKVWIRYQNFMNAAKEHLKNINWKTEQEGALSVIYNFEDVKIITVYLKNTRKVEIVGDISKNSNRLNRKIGLSIDYVCGNVLQDNRQNALLTQIRLFEGVTYNNGIDTYNALIKALENKEYI